MAPTIHLSFLPPEILDHIFQSRDISFLVLQLIKCGDRSFNSKLFNSITYIDLRDKRLGTSSRYPKLLSSFTRLRYLSLDRGQWPLMPTPADLSREIQHLALPNLETLRLKCAQAHQCFYLFNAQSEPIVSSYERGTSCLIDFTSLFPHLRTLKVAPPTGAALASSVFAGLPPKLTHLIMPRLDISNSPYPFMSQLPRSLEILDTEVYIMTHADKGNPWSTSSLWTGAPSSLRIIKSILCPQAPSGDLQLPHTLEECYFRIYQSWPLSVLQTLPSSMKTMPMLDLSKIGDHSRYFDYPSLLLPNSLTAISIQLSSSQHELIIPMIRTLSKNITSVHITGKDTNWDSLFEDFLTTHKDKCLWPAHLTSLKLRTSWPQNLVPYLPSALTYLGVRWNGNDELDLKSYPRSLKTIKLTISSNHTAKIRLTKDIPPNLTSLTLYSNMKKTLLQTDSIRFLPPTLTNLDIADGIRLSTAPLDDFQLPNALKTLAVAYWDHEWLALLPPTLTSLHLRHFDFHSVSPDIMNSSLHSLPADLESLHVEKKSGTLRPFFDSWTFLTRLICLKSLDLLDLDHLEPTILEYLPKSIRHLQLSLTSFPPQFRRCVNQSWIATIIDLADRDYSNFDHFWPIHCRRASDAQAASFITMSTQYPHPIPSSYHYPVTESYVEESRDPIVRRDFQ